jgi:hypothetical protein
VKKSWIGAVCTFGLLVALVNLGLLAPSQGIKVVTQDPEFAV